MTVTHRFGQAAFTRFSFFEPKSTCTARARGTLITATATLSLLLFWASPSAAESIYDNLNQSTDGTCGTEFDLACAQRFVAGPGTITSIELPIFALFGGDTFGIPTVSIYTDDGANLLPLSLYATLPLAVGATVATGAPGNAVQFDASGVIFRAYTAYWVVLTGSGDVEWAYTNCAPGGDGACDAATVPGDPNSAAGFMTFSDVGDPTGLAFYYTTGTEQMEIEAAPEPSKMVMALCGMTLVLGSRRRVAR